MYIPLKWRFSFRFPIISPHKKKRKKKKKIPGNTQKRFPSPTRGNPPQVYLNYTPPSPPFPNDPQFILPHFTPSKLQFSFLLHSHFPSLSNFLPFQSSICKALVFSNPTIFFLIESCQSWTQYLSNRLRRNNY